MTATTPGSPPDPDDASGDVAVESGGSFGRRLGAGVIDSACSSAATFLTTLYAAHFFSRAELGAYALFFSGFVLAAGLIAAFVYTPAEVAVVAREESVRLFSLRYSVRAGAVLGGASAVLIMGFSVLVQRQVPLHLRLTFAIPSVLLAVISPMQDHVRRMFHSAGHSWLAVRVSLVQFAIVGAVMIVFIVEPRHHLYAPTLGLTGANVVSLGFGLLLARRASAGADRSLAVRFGVLELADRGKLLLAEAALGFGAPYLVVLVLTNIVNIGVVGSVEGVRILSQPILVLGTGLIAPMAPRLYGAGADRDADAGRRYTWQYARLVLLAGSVYAVLVAVPWPGSPLPHLFPAAYNTHGLLAAQLVLMVLGIATVPYGLLLIGGGWQSRLIVVQGINILLNLAVSPTGLVVGAFASPIGSAATFISGYFASIYYTRRMFATPAGTSVSEARRLAQATPMEQLVESAPL